MKKIFLLSALMLSTVTYASFDNNSFEHLTNEERKTRFSELLSKPGGYEHLPHALSYSKGQYGQFKTDQLHILLDLNELSTNPAIAKSRQAYDDFIKSKNLDAGKLLDLHHGKNADYKKVFKNLHEVMRTETRFLKNQLQPKTSISLLEFYREIILKDVGCYEICYSGAVINRNNEDLEFKKLINSSACLWLINEHINKYASNSVSSSSNNSTTDDNNMTTKELARFKGTDHNQSLLVSIAGARLTGPGIHIALNLNKLHENDKINEVRRNYDKSFMQFNESNSLNLEDIMKQHICNVVALNKTFYTEISYSKEVNLDKIDKKCCNDYEELLDQSAKSVSNKYDELLKHGTLASNDEQANSLWTKFVVYSRLRDATREVAYLLKS